MLSAGADGQIVDRVVFKDTRRRRRRDRRGQSRRRPVRAACCATTSSPMNGPRSPPIEADIPTNRTNDSRVDRTGGFWIGTMGRKPDGATGNVHRYRAGEVDEGDQRHPHPQLDLLFARRPHRLLHRCGQDDRQMRPRSRNRPADRPVGGLFHHGRPRRRRRLGGRSRGLRGTPAGAAAR